MAFPTFVVFDLDGTLVDSEAGILQSFHATLRDRGRSASDPELRNLIGPPLRESFAQLGFEGHELDEVVALYRTHYDESGLDLCHLFDGIEHLLAGVRDGGVRLAVATAKRVDFAERVLNLLSIREYFEVVCGASLDGALNFKDEIVGKALDELGSVSRGAGWMVGDRREDMTAAQSHSLFAVGALWGFGSRQELVENGAKLLVDGPPDVLRWIESDEPVAR